MPIDIRPGQVWGSLWHHPDAKQNVKVLSVQGDALSAISLDGDKSWPLGRVRELDQHIFRGLFEFLQDDSDIWDRLLCDDPFYTIPDPPKRPKTAREKILEAIDLEVLGDAGLNTLDMVERNMTARAVAEIQAEVDAEIVRAMSLAERSSPDMWDRLLEMD